MEPVRHGRERRPGAGSRGERGVTHLHLAEERKAGCRERRGRALAEKLRLRAPATDDVVVEALGHLGVAVEELDVPVRPGERVGVLEELDIVQINAPVDWLACLRDARGEAVPCKSTRGRADASAPWGGRSAVACARNARVRVTWEGGATHRLRSL